MDELKKLSEPLVAYLKDHYDPYTEIVIKMDSIEVKQNVMGIPTGEG